MINGNLNQFLDTGWYTEATLFYNGYIYWCEGDTNPENGISHFWVTRWKAEKDDEMSYHSLVDKEGRLVDCEKVFDIRGKDLEYLKKEFLQADIFDGRSFWDVEQNLAWLDEGEDIYIS